jgi:TrmH RNA methyltransferase
MAKDELKVCGLNAVLAIAARRRDDIIRVYLVEERMRELGSLLRWCAAERRAYHVVPAEELARVADTIHHEGVCILARPRPMPTLDELTAALDHERGPACILFLEDVRNPHNLGAILRTAAHFGVRAVLVDRDGALAFTPSLLRTAEGGAESVDVVSIEDRRAALAMLTDRGFTVFATSSHARRSIYDVEVPPRVVFAIGAEGEGLSSALLGLAHERVTISGTGEVESLNVSAATAVLTSEHWRTHRGRRTSHAAPSSEATWPTGQVRPRSNDASSAAARPASREAPSPRATPRGRSSASQPRGRGAPRGRRR